MIGRSVGKYQIVKKLGEGGMGAVWLAQDTFLNRPVAMKFLAERLSGFEDARRRFVREARAASALQHPAIATVYDAGDDGDGGIFIAFQYIDGRTVSELVAQGPISEKEAVRVAREVAEALEHAHSQGILHRDVTGRNIMIDRSGRAMVVDFGLALPEGESRLTVTGSTLGTVAYLAPEVARGDPGTARGDVYGLGVVLYEMLMGQLPFAGERPEIVLYKVVHEEPQWPRELRPDLSPDVDEVVRTAMAKEPALRYPTADRLARDLELLEKDQKLLPFVPDETVPIRAPKPAITTAYPGGKGIPKKARPRRKHLWMGAATLVAAGIAALLFSQSKEGPGVSGAPLNYASLAVLPIQNQSAEPTSSNHIALGIGASLAERLAKLSGLRVTPWETSRRYSPDEMSAFDIAQELNVEALLVGSLRKRSGKLTLSMSLLDGSTGSQAWVRDVEVEESDLLRLEEKAAMEIGTRMKGRMGATERKGLKKSPTENSNAYDLYLQGVQTWTSNVKEVMDQALVYFEKALTADPNLAEAHVGVGAVHSARYFFGWGELASLEQSESEFRKALALDPELMRARRGLIHIYWERGEAEACLKLGQEVKEMNRTDVEALLARAEAFWMGGLCDLSTPLFEEAIRLDPTNEAAHWDMVVAQAWAGRFEEAVTSADAYLRDFGEDPEIHLWAGFSSQALKRFDVARTHLDKAVELFGRDTNQYVYLYAASFYKSRGDDVTANDLVKRAVSGLENRLAFAPDNPRMRSLLGALYIMSGQAERGLALMQANQNEGYFEYLYLILGFGALNDMQRYQQEVAGLISADHVPPPGLVTALGILFPNAFKDFPELSNTLEVHRKEEARLRGIYGT